MTDWVPNDYLERGRSLGLDEAKLRMLVREGKRLQALGIPVLFNLEHVVAITGTRKEIFDRILRRKSDPYRAFRVKKRSGGYRIIVVPDQDLLIVQRWIHQKILKLQKPNHASTAFSSGNNVLKNAAMHCNSPFIVKLDIESFFESISERQVFHVFREIGYPGKLAFELARVCTRVSGGEYKYSRPKWSAKGRETVRGERVIFRLGHLPQGAPTSPTLANLVCRKMDTQLSEIAGRYHCNYTRYADDITFSGLDLDEGTAKVLLVHAIDIVKKAGFRPNSKKTRIIRPGVRKIVTGLIVNGKAPTLSKSFKDRVRAHLYFVKTKGAAEHCENQGFSSILSFKEHLWGLIIYAGSIDGRFGEKCKSKYAEIEWF